MPIDVTQASEKRLQRVRAFEVGDLSILKRWTFVWMHKHLWL